MEDPNCFEVQTGSSQEMNAHMGLALIQFAWAQVNGEIMITDLEPIFDDIDDNISNLNSFIEDEIVPDFSELKFRDLFFAETYDIDYFDFSDSLKILMETLGDQIDLLGSPIETFGDSLDVGLFSSKNFEYHVRTVKTGSSDFTFYLEIEDNDTLIFNRTFFDNQNALDQYNSNWNSSIDDGFDCMDDEFYDLPFDENTFATCITHFQAGINNGGLWCNTLETIITNEPMVAFDIETDFIDDLRSILNDIDELLSGKEYDIGPLSEGKKIIPLNILRASHKSRGAEFNGFYFSTNPYTYDFGGIFPYGLNQHVIDQISADAVLYEDYNDDMTFMDRWINMEADWKTVVDSGSDDPDPHMGLAVSKCLQLIDSTIGNLNEAFDYLEESKFNLFYDSWQDIIDISDELDEIKNHLTNFSDAKDAMFIVLVIEDQYNSGASHDIQSSTDFYAIPFHSINAEMVLDISDGIINGVQAISDISNEFYTNMDNMLDMDLNPAYLDLSEINNELDLIDIFKQSNPNWLSLTGAGIKWFHDAGKDLENAFEEIHSFSIQLDDYLQDNDLTLMIEEEVFNTIKDLSLELYNDFADPGTVTVIDGENVNLSAWFYYPPPSFLTLWENVALDDAISPDNSINCLFPDQPTNLDCNAECYGIATLDECGICGGAGIAEGACNCEGNVDLGCGCGIYDELPTDGCDDVCGSTLVNDECGVCGGTIADAAQCIEACSASQRLGCDGVCYISGTQKINDACGVCNGPGAIYACGCTEFLDCGCNQSDDSDRLVCDASDCPGDGIGLGDQDGDGFCDDADECVGVYDECAICNGSGAIYECGCADIPEGDCDCAENVNDECGVCNGYGSSCTYIKSSVTTTVDDADLSEMDTFKENFSTFIETALALPGGTVEVINVSILARGSAIIEVEFTITLTEEELALTDFESVADITDALEETKNEISDGLPPFIYGCTDSGAENYDANANIDDGSCTLEIYNSEIPEGYSLSTYPNPFNPITNITYALPENVNAKIIIYDLSGKQVQSLVNGFKAVGYHSVGWNADGYSSGMYFVRMSIQSLNGNIFDEYVMTKRILFIK